MKKSHDANAARVAKRGKRRARFDWWKLPWLLLIPLGFCWPRICEGHADWIELYYSGTVYPIVKDALSVITSLVPISVAELVLYALLLGVAVEVLGNLVAWLLRRINWKRMLSVLLNIAILGGVLLNLFYLTWGFNYFREPLDQRMGLTVKARPTSELVALTEALTDEANAVRALVREDASGVVALTTSLQSTLDELPRAYEKLGARNDIFNLRTTRAKRVLYSEGLSWMGIAGVYVGLTGEPNINVRQPALLIPHGAAHEMAHQLGVASEDAAEFTGFLACMESEDLAVYYSGLANALLHCRKALKKVDPDAAQAVLSSYSDAVLRDFVAYDAYWDAFNGPVEEAVTRTNDAYLKYNAQESGVQSYGEVVDLLLAYYDLTNN